MLSRTLVLCALTLAAARPADELAYAPDTKTTWTLSFEETSEFELESMTQSLNGTEITGPSPEMSGKISRRVEVSDRGLEVQEGRMASRSRTFEEVEGECSLQIAAMGQEMEFGVSFESELGGQELRIDWDEDAESYVSEFVGDDPHDESLLDGLLEDLDYKALLPPEGAEEGDSWDVDLAGARSLFSPGGELSLIPVEAPEVSGDIIEAHDMVAIAMMSVAEGSREIEGELSATWTETLAEEGARLAVISLELEATFSADVSEEVQEKAGSAGLPEREDYRFVTEWEVEGHGELRWDLDAGHFHALDLELEDMLEATLGFRESFGDLEVEVETSGETQLKARAEREE